MALGVLFCLGTRFPATSKKCKPFWTFCKEAGDLFYQFKVFFRQSNYRNIMKIHERSFRVITTLRYTDRKWNLGDFEVFSVVKWARETKDTTRRQWNLEAWNRYQRLSQFSWSESQFEILIVSDPWPCLDLMFPRNSVKVLSKFCNARSNKRRMLLSGCFWLKGIIMSTPQNVKAPEDMCFPAQSSDCDVMWSRGQDVLSSRMFCWATFVLS